MMLLSQMYQMYFITWYYSKETMTWSVSKALLQSHGTLECLIMVAQKPFQDKNG